MNFKELGDTNISIPDIGLGTWDYTGEIEPLRYGINLGASLIDTAESYGTEGLVGEVIQGIREKVFLATKVSPEHLAYKDVLRAADDSLQRLQTDYIDLYQVHWPNPSVPIEETMAAMEELVRVGKIRFIGVSNFSKTRLQDAQQALKKCHIASNQVLYSLIHRRIEKNLLQYCQTQKITIIAYTPLASGKLANRNAPEPQYRSMIEALHQVAQETGYTPAQVALNWCISTPSVVAIPKSNRLSGIQENCSASGWTISAHHRVLLDNAFDSEPHGQETAWGEEMVEF